MGRRLFLILSLLVVLSTSSLAATIGFSGNFSVDDDVQLFSYTVQSTGPVTVATTSYAGGGFQTILTLFDVNGNFLFDNTGYGTATDAAFSWVSVANAQYIVALTQYDNFAVQPTLADGFVQQGNGNFTATLPFNNPTPGGSFLLPGGEQRTSDWAVEFTSADPTLSAQTVPEPSTLFLTGAAFVACWNRFRRKNSSK